MLYVLFCLKETKGILNIKEGPEPFWDLLKMKVPSSHKQWAERQLTHDVEDLDLIYGRYSIGREQTQLEEQLGEYQQC